MKILSTYICEGIVQLFAAVHKSFQKRRLGYQPLFERGARATPRSHGWTRGDSIVSLSESDNRPQIFVGHKSVHNLSRQNTVNKIADDFRVLTSGFSKRLASHKRPSRENSCFSNSLKVKRVGKLQWNSFKFKPLNQVA